MSIRVTTNGTLHTYKSNLMRSYKSLGDAITKVQTQRSFNSFAEDPAAASQAFRLRRSIWRTDAQLTNSESVINKYESAWDALESVKNDLGEEMAKVAALRGDNPPTASGRQPLGQVLASAAQSVVQTMNVKYGDTFIFSGADGLNVPFSWDENTGELLFRGKSLNVGGVPQPETPLVAGDAASEAEWDAYNADQAALKELQGMAGEATYVDLGLGLSEDMDGNLITSSAFNSALSGITYLGYGVDEDGDPKNVASIMMELSDIFTRCTASGEFELEEDAAKADRLTDKLEAALSELTNQHSSLDADTTFLKSNKTRLEDSAYTQIEQLNGIEDCEMADAITALTWAQYSYNAALKIGNSILSQSLIDYMN